MCSLSTVLCLEWRSGVAGHLILSDEDLTSVVQGSWKRLNTLQHYKVIILAWAERHVAPSHLAKLQIKLLRVSRPRQVPDGATVALVPRHTKHIHHDNHDYVAGESELTGGLLARSSAVVMIRYTGFCLWTPLVGI